MTVPIRIRVTTAFVVAMAVVLGVTGVLVYDRFRSGLDQTIDDALAARSSELAAAVGAGLPPDAVLATPQVPYAGLVDAEGNPVAGAGGGVPTELIPQLPVETDETPVPVPIEAVPGTTRGGAPNTRTDGSTTAAPPSLGVAESENAGNSRVLVTPVGDEQYLVLGIPLETRDAALTDLRRLLWIGLPAALLLAALAAYGVAWGALRPVEAMRRRAADIPLTVDGRRLPEDGAGGELGRLAATLNDMLGRIERGVIRERALVADASHEIRTPLASLQAELELASRPGSDAAALRAAIGRARSRAGQLGSLAEGMLLLARVEAGELPLQAAAIPVAPWVSDVVEQRIGHLADAPPVVIDTPPELTVEIDRDVASRALGNVIDNAARHARHQITITARAASPQVVIEVRDDGAGFPDDFLDSAFERFTQADRARSQSGAGIGLSIVRAIVEAHGGTVSAHNDGGAVVALRLPATSPSDQDPEALV